MKATILLGLIFVSACVPSNEQGRASAGQIASASQLIGGPKALGQLGDYVIENDHVRFIIQGPGPNRAASLYPGGVLDADVQRVRGEAGNDQLGELVSMFAFEAFKPTRFSVTEGEAAEEGVAIVVEGVSGEFVEQVALINTALLFSTNLSFRVEYRLKPGAHHLEIITTIENTSGAEHAFPFLAPSDLKDLGLDVAGIDEIELSSPLGVGFLTGGIQHEFAPGKSGSELYFSLQDAFDKAPGLPAFPGLVVPFFATHGNGVSYGISVPPSEQNYVRSFADYYGVPNQFENNSLLVPFTFSGLVGLFHSKPPDRLAPGDSFSYSMNLHVGHGDVASVSDLIYEENQIATGTLTGQVLDEQTKRPIDGAFIYVLDESERYVTMAESDSHGAFRAKVPPGSYVYRVRSEPYETSAAMPVKVESGQTASVLHLLNAPGQVGILVRDEEGRALPSRISLVGRFNASNLGQDPKDFLYDLTIGERRRPITLEEGRQEYIEESWASRDGVSSKWVKPGDYNLVISRGIEYDSVEIPITVVSGQSITKEIVLKKAFDSKGYVLGDMHLHSINSSDSSLTLDDRVVAVAAEGVEYAVATDHNYITDYQSAIYQAGLGHWLTSSVGTEVTTFEMGHFNGYPILHDSSSSRGGDITWVGETPTSIFQQIRSLGRDGPDQTIVQVNHPRWDVVGYFSAFNFNQEDGGPKEKNGLSALISPASDAYAVDEFSFDFDTIEILTGKPRSRLHSYRVPDPLPPEPLPDVVPDAGALVRNSFGEIAFPGVVEDWFSLLNQGLRATGVGNSDSHSGTEPPGFPGTFIWVGEGKDHTGGYSDKDTTKGLQDNRAIVSFGPFIEAFVNGMPVGSTVTDTDGSIDVSFRVQSANWSPSKRS